jgi:cell division protein ZapD
VILYEYPFNERIRTYLRLQQLFDRLAQLVPRTDAMDHHFALTTIFEVMDVGARADLKSDVLKDLEKQKQVFIGYRGNPAISEAALDQVIGQIEACFEALNGTSGKAGQSLTENDWLMSIRSRVGIPGGTCEFDLPAYFAWQHRSPDIRVKDLHRWAGTLAPLADSIHLLLKMLRDSGAPQKVIATGGQFQQTLPQGRTFQLLRLALDPSLHLIPEISGNRLMVSIRLMQLLSPVGAREWTSRFGFDPERQPDNLTQALGSGSTNPMQMAGAYAVLANGGYRVTPYLITKVIDARGNVVSEAKPAVVPAAPAAKPAVTTSKVILAGDALFVSGKSGIKDLSRDGKIRLDEVVAKIQALGSVEQIKVVGHADPTGNTRVNRALSEARARSVKSYLVAKGIKPGIIATAGLINALHLTNRDLKTAKIVCNGAGAAAIACVYAIDIRTLRQSTATPNMWERA